MIGFFSSDARDLYKEDIYRALALPEDFVLHFRYRTKYVDSDISYSPSGIVGSEGIIFHSMGNLLDTREQDKEIKNVSIRSVSVKDVHKDPNTKLIHFYLQLKKFVDVKIHEDERSDKLPPERFVSDVQVTEGPNSSWIERIQEIEGSFSDTLFFNLNRLSKENGTVVTPEYSSSQKKSLYRLQDEREYTLDFSFYDVREGSSRLYFQTAGDALSVDIPEESTLGALKDYRVHTLTTRSLNTQKRVARMKFGAEYETDHQSETFDVDLPVTVVRQKSKPAWFAFFTVLTFLGLAMGQLATKKATEVELGWINLIILMMALVTFGAGSASLYRFFNKK